MIGGSTEMRITTICS